VSRLPIGHAKGRVYSSKRQSSTPPLLPGQPLLERRSDVHSSALEFNIVGARPLSWCSTLASSVRPAPSLHRAHNAAFPVA
jgi:hypothetical protein